MEENNEDSPSGERNTEQSVLEMELEVLQSIYVNEVDIICKGKSTIVSIDLHPATADNLSVQFVMMTLRFTLDSKYPYSVPEMHIRNSRGLSDEKLHCIIQDLKMVAETKIGNSMLFELILAAKEYITKNNWPCGDCAICLCCFTSGDVFTITDCYHYFHSHCLAGHSKKHFETMQLGNADNNWPFGAKNVPKKKLPCPVCRLPIHIEGSEEDFPPPKEVVEVVGKDIMDIQKKMAVLYQKQVDKGGIIDIEAEKNKFFLNISDK